MKFSLEFKSRFTEEEFSCSKRPFHIDCQKFISALLVLQIAQLLFLRPMDLDFSEYPTLLPLGIVTIVMIFFIMFLSCKYPSHEPTAISLIVLTVSIYSAEFIYQILSLRLQQPYWIYLLIGLNEQVIGIFLILSRVSWLRTFFNFTLTNIYTWVRLLSKIKDFHEVPKISYIFFCFQIIVMIGFSYFLEKTERKFYLNLECKTVQLRTFEEIMKNAIQNSLIIMKNDKVLFYNNYTRRNFSIQENLQILEVLRTIKIIRKIGFNSERDVKKESDNNIGITLYELYKDCEAYHNENTSDDVDSPYTPGFSCVEAELEHILPENVKTYSIQFGPTFWKNELGIAIFISDISHIKSYYKKLDGNKDNLLATVSHDLRAPLNGILGMLSLLLEEVWEESAREKLNISIVSAKLMQNMINDILDYSLLSKGKLRLKFETINVSTLVTEIKKILSLQAGLKGIRLEFENFLQNDEENHVVDGNRLRQVLFNLIGNAIKFTKMGKVVIRLRAGSLDAPDPALTYQGEKPSNIDIINNMNKGDINLDFEARKDSIDLSAKAMTSFFLTKQRWLFFEVEDSGVGIKREDISRLFKLFSRVTAGHDNNMSGIGLGLAISQSLVMMMNSGRRGAVIKAESIFGQGSTFSFPLFVEEEPTEYFKEVLDEKYRLPIFNETKTLESKNKKETLLSPNKANSSLGELECFLSEKPKKIDVLIVDDDQINLLVASKYLKSSGDTYSYHSAPNGEEAIKLVKELATKGQYFDVIFMDCQMPILDGFETSKRLKTMMNEKRIPRSPIVALTGNNLDSDYKCCIDCGMDLFLSKPYMKTDMIKKIDEAVKIKLSME